MLRWLFTRCLVWGSCVWLAAAAGAVESVSVLTWNVSGNGTTNFGTNMPQVQAIGRIVQHLNPDIVTFQEIPFTNTWQLPQLMRTYLPGYAFVTNSGTDGFLRSAIASRWPITRSTKWLDGVSLTNFGYNGLFTRDLFEAQVAVPGFDLPLHVFTTHLKSGQDSTSSSRRAAEANAISNFLVTAFLSTNAARPYLLTGDFNEDLARPPSSNPQTLQRLTSAPTGLQLTTPRNPVTASELTYSARSTFTKRYDYILPGGLLFSNLATGLVFRTDVLVARPPGLLADDDATASDHAPVLAVFRNPFNTPFRLLSVAAIGAQITLRWEAAAGRQYQVEASSDFTAWVSLHTNLVATGTVFTFTTNRGGEPVRGYRVRRVP